MSHEKKVKIFDTTLRDGSQTRDVSFSIKEKREVALRLDQLGIDFIEAGWVPGNPKDGRFFQEFKQNNLEKAKLVALSSTRRADSNPENDLNLQALLETGAPVVGVVGKSWHFHANKVLGVSPEENLSMVQDSVSYLSNQGREVIFDAEHYFDGFKADPNYAMDTVLSAQQAGASQIGLCDTNGGTMPSKLREIVKKTKGVIRIPLSIHAHDDSGMATANSIEAVKQGVEVVQGTINGFGERVGNANLCTIIPNLILKEGFRCLNSKESLKDLTSLSRFISEVANKNPEKSSPYVGVNAFSHKAGLHVDAVLKSPETFEHVPPESVGNERKILVSELSGGSTIRRKLKNLGVDLNENEETHREVLSNIQKLEEEGYQFENADASFALLAKRVQNELPSFFQVLEYEILTSRIKDEEPIAKASVKLSVDGEIRDAIERGHGPVDALDNAFHRCLKGFYQRIENMRLANYKVRILESSRGTAAIPRVLIEMTDGENSWNTVGVSEDIIEASWEALRDGYIYGLLTNTS